MVRCREAGLRAAGLRADVSCPEKQCEGSAPMTHVAIRRSDGESSKLFSKTRGDPMRMLARGRGLGLQTSATLARAGPAAYSAPRIYLGLAIPASDAQCGSLPYPTFVFRKRIPRHQKNFSPVEFEWSRLDWYMHGCYWQHAQ